MFVCSLQMKPKQALNISETDACVNRLNQFTAIREAVDLQKNVGG